MEFMVVDAEGRAVGLLCIWDPEVFQLSDCCSNRHFIMLAGIVLNSFDCVVINVYAPNDPMRRGKLWETLVNLKASFTKPWCLVETLMKLDQWMKEWVVQEGTEV